ncbi:flightin [Contarinia nasturtii]|uniref:flightin n=1 Tax=Contarinia nasturtii TaxID=265458 RepID=UPI0012D3F954|nr:flightin [Contarinia nasturtii]
MAEEGGFNFDDFEESADAAAAVPDAPEAIADEAMEDFDADADADPSAAVAKAADALPEAEVPPPDEDGPKRPVRWYRHWVRPKFLQYRYMYDYRTNYYNDVIEYLDKRAKGVNCEIPRAQTWAERVLRTHTNPSVLDYYKNQKKEDKHLIQTIAASIKTHNYHTKAYINQRYASVL